MPANGSLRLRSRFWRWHCGALAHMAIPLLGGCSDSSGSPAGPMAMWQGNVLENDSSTDSDRGEDAGTYEDAEASIEGDASFPNDPESTDCIARLVARQEVRATLAACRSCHTANGLAANSSLVLTREAAMDEARLRSAFKEVGYDLLAMPAEENGLKHPGGKRLIKETPAYDTWKILLGAFDNPNACSAPP